MIRDLRNFFRNPLDSPAISLTELLAFSTDHLGRISKQNLATGRWTARIAAVSPAMAALDAAHSGDLIEGANRTARKQAKNDVKSTLPAQADKIVSFVRAHFGKGSPEVRDCAPNGLAVLAKAPDDEVKHHLDRLIEGVQKVVATVGNEVLTKATDLKAAWMAIYTASEDSAAGKSFSEAEQRAARQALQRELFLTLLDLAAEYPNQPEQLGLFMQQHLLGGPATGGGGGGTGGGGEESESSESSEDEEPESSSISSTESMEESESSLSSFSSEEEALSSSISSSSEAP